jgi:2-C-methyl-D-erythritol 2,4-cyclodiphosphate synthase
MIRIGHGYDVHKFAQNRKCIIGGVEIPFEMGLLGHSDADVLLHAICDALLGAAGLGDIGKHFPDNDNAFLNIDSRILLRKTVALLKEKGYKIGNIDATVIAQAPRLSRYIETMRENIATVLALPIDSISIKATTEEGLGFTGEGLGIATHAVCLLFRA